MVWLRKGVSATPLYCQEKFTPVIFSLTIGWYAANIIRMVVFLIR